METKESKGKNSAMMETAFRVMAALAVKSNLVGFVEKGKHVLVCQQQNRQY